MDLATLFTILRNSIIQIMILSAPVLLISVALGIIISIIQATTSIQDQTLTFVPKIIAVLIILIVMGNTMFNQMNQFTEYLMGLIPEISNNSTS